MDTERQVNSHEQEGQRQRRQGQEGLLTRAAATRGILSRRSLEADIHRAYTLRYKLIPAAKAEYRRLAKILDAETFVAMSTRYGVERRTIYRSGPYLLRTNPAAYNALMARRAMLLRRMRQMVYIRDLQAEWKSLTLAKLKIKHGVTRECLRYVVDNVKDQVRNNA